MRSLACAALAVLSVPVATAGTCASDPKPGDVVYSHQSDERLLRQYPYRASFEARVGSEVRRAAASRDLFQHRLTALKEEQKKLAAERPEVSYGRPPPSYQRLMDVNSALIEAQTAAATSSRKEFEGLKRSYDTQLQRLGPLWAGCPGMSGWHAQRCLIVRCRSSVHHAR